MANLPSRMTRVAFLEFENGAPAPLGDTLPAARHRGAHNCFERPVESDRVTEVRVEGRARV
jgi:hypothetical protein